MIETETIENISEQIKNLGVSEQTVSELRTKWPKLHFTYCMDDDICGPKPFYESDVYNLYLVDGQDHCMKFTTNQETATGLVIAEREEDDECD